MNLRFPPPVLALALSISASARIVSQASVDTMLAESFFQTQVAEKITARRRAKKNSAAIFDQEAINGGRFYSPDVGILQGRKHRGGVQRGVKTGLIPRFLQTEEEPRCGANGTCAPSFCDVYGSRFTGYAAASELNAICNGYTDANGKNWTFEGCYRGYPGYPGMQEYQKNGYCQIAQCVVDGGSAGSCYCQVYHHACEVYGNERPYDPSSAGFCEIDACCQNKTDEAGKRSCLSGYPHVYPNLNKYRQENPRCGTNGTCSPSICNCVANQVGKFKCAAPLNDICNGVTDSNGTKWGFEGCYRDYRDYPDFQMYHKTAYCEFAKCVVDGGTYGSCYCQVYNTLCEVFGDIRKYNYDGAGFCTIGNCCKSKVDEAGKVSCLGMTNSTPTTSPSTEEVVSNPAQNSSSAGTNATPDAATEETSTANDPPSSSSAPRTSSLSSVGAMSSVVAAAALSLSILGCDV